ncbi:MAG TPA: histidine kinase [Chthoniobacteraceae bacterium]|jgi:signal transduction histidine kinase|nr:histidine kinase [Chthoniobacteraceae bacterium]
MRFPPPIRIVTPLLALVFGLTVTWFDYRLNLDLDLARHLDEMRELTDANGDRLARLSEKLLATEQREALQADVEAMGALPQLESAGVVDDNGRVLADSTGRLYGQQARGTALAKAASLITRAGVPGVRRGEDAAAVFGVYPIRLADNKTGWVLLEFDRTAAIGAASTDARTQLRWMASAMTLLSFALWGVLHFGFAERLARLADAVQAFGEGNMDATGPPGGSDEVGQLSTAFRAMVAKLREREARQIRLEREVLEISESEKRRIGHDLHDGLGQQLTAASMATNALVAAMKIDAPAFAQRADDIGCRLRNAIADVRALSHGLAPVALADDGLMSALSALAESTNRSGVRCAFECSKPVRESDAEVAGHLHRIAQEAVNNALKHAAPSEIRIGLELRGGSLVLEVDDDGAGFDPATASDGIGLRVMRYRAKLIGGALEIGPAPAGGARVCCRVNLTA